MEAGEQRGEPTVAEPFIDKREVCRRLGVSVRTVELWMRQGFLPYYKLGNSVRFKWSEIERHLGRHCRFYTETPVQVTSPPRGGAAEARP